MKYFKGGVRMPLYLRKMRSENTTIPVEGYLNRVKDASIGIGLMCTLGVLCVGLVVADYCWKKWPTSSK